MVESPTTGDILLDLLLICVEELIGKVKTGGSMDSSDDTCAECSIVRDTGWAKDPSQEGSKKDHSQDPKPQKCKVSAV